MNYYCSVIMENNSKTLPVGFKWPKESYFKLLALAKENDLTFQTFVISTMKRKVLDSQKIDQNKQ